MKEKTIRNNLQTSGILCVVCLVLGAVCLYMRFTEYAAILAFVALIQAVLFGIWFSRRHKAKQRSVAAHPNKHA